MFKTLNAKNKEIENNFFTARNVRRHRRHYRKNCDTSSVYLIRRKIRMDSPVDTRLPHSCTFQCSMKRRKWITIYSNKKEAEKMRLFTNWMSRVNSSSCLVWTANSFSFSLPCFMAVIFLSSINFLVLFWFFSRKRRSLSALLRNVLSFATSFAVSTAIFACFVFKSLFSLLIIKCLFLIDSVKD